MRWELRKAVAEDVDTVFEALSERHRIEYELSGIDIDEAHRRFRAYVAAFYAATTILVDGEVVLVTGCLPLENGYTSTWACATEAFWDSGAIGVRALREVARIMYLECGPFLTSTKPTPDARWKRWIGLIGFKHVVGDVYGYDGSAAR